MHRDEPPPCWRRLPTTPMTNPDLYVRRADQQLVEAFRYTGENRDELARWAGIGFPVDDVPPWAWVVRDDDRVYVVPAVEFWSHVRSRPME